MQAKEHWTGVRAALRRLDHRADGDAGGIAGLGLVIVIAPSQVPGLTPPMR
jgi:hypothetical protein